MSNISNITAIDLSIGDDHSLENISAEDVFSMTDNNNLTILGDEGDNVTLANPSQWSKNSMSSCENGHELNVYTTLIDTDQITLKIEIDISVV